jgi:NADPH-dependent 2,4-dienoyl-CoA reductase/sulfur reductase-like enzyme
MFLNQPVECRMNAFMGHEAEMSIQPAAEPKQVMVVGAGPAGLEAARVAAARGHRVTLYDKNREIGGLMPMAAFIKGEKPDDLMKGLEYYRTQLKKLGVKMELGKEVTPELVQKVRPDAVILAPGGQPVDLQIDGMDRSNAVTTEALKGQAKGFLRFLGARQLSALTKVFLPTGKRVVVVGGDLAGLEAVEFLVKRGKEVAIVEEAEAIGQGALVHWMVRYMPWLEARGIPVYTGVQYQEITPQGLVIRTSEGEEKLLEADTVMVITQYTQNHALFQALQDEVPALHLIGDAKEEELAYIAGAIHDGARAGLAV